jgi:hypothetical protein
MKIMIGFKASNEFKKFLEKQADTENRSLSNFIVNALIVYTKEHHSIDWKEPEKKLKK